MPSPARKISHRSGALQTIMLAGDAAGSVLTTMAAGQRQLLAYAPYGVCHPRPGGASVLAFNGARPEPATGHYLLGNGYRAFNPVLMRFNSPDSLSPFGRGGLNSYGYAAGDPVNRTDPTGHFSLMKLLRRMVPRAFKSKDKVAPVASPSPALASSSPAPTAPQTRTLKNNYPELFQEEMGLLNRNYLSRGQDPRILITRAADLMSDKIGLEQKFVMNASGQMVTALTLPKASGGYVSHPSMTGIMDNDQVTSAGTLIAGSMGDIVVYNRSGHYRPTMEDLQPVMKYIRGLGLEPAAVPYI